MELPNEVYDRAKVYPVFQEALKTLQEVEAEFVALRESLPTEQRELLERYLTACENMDCLLAQVGYQLGYEHGKRDAGSVSFR